jgi:hypothetical protein
MTGVHITMAATNSSACIEKWKSSTLAERVTTAGMCVTTMTMLNSASAISGFDSTRSNAIPRRPSTARHSQSGVPIISSGGATRLSSMCWTMWTEYRWPSARSCTGQYDATKIVSSPAPKKAT